MKTLYSRGHRNPQGLLRDSLGRVWSTEHGPIGGDELNLIRHGADYGWPRATLGRDCTTCDWQQDGRHVGFEQPVFAWVPSIGVSNLIEVKGFDKAWDGDLLLASLKGEALRRLRVQDGRVQFDEPIAIGDRIRDIAQLADHRIALWTDSGHLMFIRAITEASPAEALLAGYPEPVRALAQDCLACHSFDAGRPRAGAIGLWEIAGRAIAATDFADYSPALRNAGGTWDAAALDAFLTDPQGAVPGTTMAYAGIKDAAIRAELIRFLTSLKQSSRAKAPIRRAS
jgi:aldose sugar dehydrogenase